jgi:hypothetical protein
VIRASALSWLVLVSLVSSLSGCAKLLGDFQIGATTETRPDDGLILVTPTKGLVTTEQGAKATFTIVLTRKPGAGVAVALSSSNSKEGTVSPISADFDQDNWAAPQTVFVTGVDDTQPDGPQQYTILTGAASSSDPTFSGSDPADPAVTNVDDETAGFTVTPAKGLLTTESGGEASFTVALNTAPTADVAIGLSSDTPGEGSLGVSGVTFTPLNWRAPQTVFVTGADDMTADGDQTYHIVTAPAVSMDARYDGLDPLDVALENQDNDTAGVTLSRASALFTSEAGQTATFGIALNSPPKKDVVISLSSDTPSEGTVTPAKLTFTPANWTAPQLVTITGVDDGVPDGNQPYAIVTAPAESDDLAYAGLDGPDATVINVDDDSAGITLTPNAAGLQTSEAGAFDTFSVALNSQPGDDELVLLDVSSSRADEGTVTPGTLRFTAQNWSAPQVVTVTGQDDEVADGSQAFWVHVSPDHMTSNPSYLHLPEVDAAVTNIDNDSPGVTVTAAGVLGTSEAGDSATFTIVLRSKPAAPVTIGLHSSNKAEGSVSPSSVVFTAANYAAPQLVTVTGLNDDAADGNQPYRVITDPAASDDLGYAGIDPSNVDVLNVDDDSPGIRVQPTTSLVTTERGGAASFTVVLTSAPAAPVKLALSSSNPLEGVVSPASLVFTPANFGAPQVVTVTGVDDDAVDGSQPYRVVLAAAVSDDGKYRDIDAPDVNLLNTDDDSAGISVMAAASLTTSEDLGVATFRVVLNSLPAKGATVVVPLTSSRPSEASVSPATLTFTTSNWAAPQTVTVTGVNDDAADGNQPFRVITQPAMSGDGAYDQLDALDVNLTNIDNDSPGFTVTPSSRLSTSEVGGPEGSATFTVALSSRPSSDVSIALHSSKLGEGVVSPESLTFTPANFGSKRTVTVTGVNDDVADGNQPYFIVLDPATSMDKGYAELDPPDISLLNVDNDSPGITVTPALGYTSEDKFSTTFTIALHSQPAAGTTVTIGLKSSDEGEGQPSPASVVFTPTNWAAPQAVTITGVNDSVADGAQPYTILTAPAESADPKYADIDPDDVSLFNLDNDSAGISVSGPAGTTSEDLTSTTFTVVLSSEPTSDVTVPLTSSDTGEGTLPVGSLTFTPKNWNKPQTVTVVGVNDDQADGPQDFTILTENALSMDTGYGGLNGPDVALTNLDNDSAFIAVIQPLVPTTGEAATATAATFSVVLTSAPTASVTILLVSSKPDEGLVSDPISSMLVFDPVNWMTPQVVTVRGVQDQASDGNQTYTIELKSATSTDKAYSGLDPNDVDLTNIDDDP